MKWRKWNNILHRDLGYLAFGLTVIYAVSGIFLNHKSDFNPNYVITKTQFEIKTDEGNSGIGKESIKNILSQNNLGTDYTEIFRPEPEEVQIFYSDKTVTLHLKERKGEIERIRSRKIIKEINLLHLNTLGKVWTYFSDLYALLLIILALTGLFVLKGKNGIKGRGAWLTILGLLIPIVFVIIYI